MKLRCFFHRIPLNEVQFAPGVSTSAVNLFECPICHRDYVFNPTRKSLTLASEVVFKKRFKPPPWPQCVVTLAEKFLADAAGDIDLAQRLMVDHFIGVGSYKPDPVLSDAVRHALVDVKARGRV